MEKRQPNFLFIMDDQHRFDYLGCAGGDFIRTPNIDRIAEGGMRFQNCFFNAPLCAPARIGLAAGLQPARMGALSNNAFLPRSKTTYYQRLRDAGYRVGSIGKLDLAKAAKYTGRYGDRPCNYMWGFTHPEECEGKMHAGSSPSPLGPYTYYLKNKDLLEDFYEDYRRRGRGGWNIGVSEDSVLPLEDFEDCYIGRKGAEWIKNIPDDFPFHLFVSFVGPHDPFDPPEEYAEHYRSAEMPARIQDTGEGKPQTALDKMKKGFTDED